MVVIEDALRTLEVEVVGGVLSPGQVDHRLQIGHLYAVVRALWVEQVEFVYLFEECLLHFLAPFLLSSQLEQLYPLWRTFTIA